MNDGHRYALAYISLVSPNKKRFLNGFHDVVSTESGDGGHDERGKNEKTS